LVCQDAQEGMNIPLGGNAFITKTAASSDPAVISNDGLGNWVLPGTVCSVYFKLTQPETFALALNYTLSTPRVSYVRFSVAKVPGASFETRIFGINDYRAQFVGKFKIPKAGYVKLDIQGGHARAQL